MSLWPNLTAPSQYPDAPDGWEDPQLPDFQRVWDVARRCGYAVGLHGSMKRDCDMIAAPWTSDACAAETLIAELCKGLNARMIGSVEHKPHGRKAWSLQVNAYVKPIDISVMPRVQDDRAYLEHLSSVEAIRAAHVLEEY